MKQRILAFWHQFRGFHCAHGELMRSNFTSYNFMIAQKCSCGEKRTTKIYASLTSPYVPYEYNWNA